MKNKRLERYAEIIRREQQALNFDKEELKFLKKHVKENVILRDAKTLAFVFDHLVMTAPDAEGKIIPVPKAIKEKIEELETPAMFALIELIER